MSWDDRSAPAPVAVVIGGDTVLGARLVEQFAARGAFVVATAPDARKIPQRLLKLGRVERVRLNPANGDWDALRRFFVGMADAFHRLDAVVYASPVQQDPGRETTRYAEHLPRLLAANIIAPWNICALASEWMGDLGGGRIVLAVTDCARVANGDAPGMQISQAAFARYAQLLEAEVATIGEPGDEDPLVAVSTVTVDPWIEDWEPVRVDQVVEQVVRAALPASA